MQNVQQGEHLAAVEKVVSGNLVDSGPDHLTVHDIAAGNDILVRVDDRTRYLWVEPRNQGLLTDNAQVRVGYYIAGGAHIAAEVLVLDPGDGESLTGMLGILAPHIH